jgi:endonuclease G
MNHKVKVPDGYYKALLRYKKGAPDGEYIACGFYLPHDSSIPSDSFMEYIMSVEELEKQTGMDFFVNLPDVIGPDKARAVKTQAPGSWWN